MLVAYESSILTSQFFCDTIDAVEEEQKSDFEPIIETELKTQETVAFVETYAANMYEIAANEERGSNSLKLNFYDLQDIIDRHCYNKVACAGYLGQLRKRLKKTQNQLKRRSSDIYRTFTDKVVEGSRKSKTKADGTVTTTTQVGLQKMDAEYRSSEYTRDLTYRKLQRREENLIERVTIVEALYESYQDKAKFILGMQKTLNNEGKQ